MSKLTSVLAGVAVLPVFALTSVASAVTYNSSLGGGNIYQAKNVTQNGAFGDPVNATCNDVLKLRVYIHNGGPLAAEGVKVKATVPSDKATSFSSTMVVSATNSDPASVTDTATVKSDKEATMKYVAGTGEYFDSKGGRLGSISDTVVTTGADVPGGVGVSVDKARYVQFQVKLNCDTPEQPKDIKVCELSTKKVITIKENQFDAAKHSKDLDKCGEVLETPPVLAKTGPAETVAVVLGAIAAGTVASRLFLSRRAARQ